MVKLPTRAELFYKHVLQVLYQEQLPFLIAGSLALAFFMHLPRKPKDMDIFIRREDCEPILDALAKTGYRTEVLHSHWLGKAWKEDMFIDFIWSSGNGVAQVDDTWYEHAVKAKLFGVPVLVCSPEDIVWSKAFIMDRERFDGADIAHLIRDSGPSFDWHRLLDRFEHHWRVLLAHLLMFQFIYPAEKIVPKWLMDTLLSRLHQEAEYQSELTRLCQGTLLSRDQYLSDIELYGYEDGRVEPHGRMTPEEATIYTRNVRREQAEMAEQAELAKKALQRLKEDSEAA